MCKINFEATTIATKDGEQIPIDVYGIEKTGVHQWQVRYVDCGEGDDYLRECGKIRPCLIISSDEYNALSDANVVVVPMSKSPMYNTVHDSLIGMRLTEDPTMISILCFNQIMFVHQSRLQNVVCDDVNSDLKVKVMEYLFNRLGMGNFFKLESPEGKTQEDQNNGIISLTERTAQQQNTIIDRLIAEALPLTPTNVNSHLSVMECNQLLQLYNIMGLQAFTELPHYNEKTVMAAIKRCKQRVSATGYQPEAVLAE